LRAPGGWRCGSGSRRSGEQPPQAARRHAPAAGAGTEARAFAVELISRYHRGGRAAADRYAARMPPHRAPAAAATLAAVAAGLLHDVPAEKLHGAVAVAFGRSMRGAAPRG
jgi:hypothetical protein